jgi:hypothetical protein
MRSVRPLFAALFSVVTLTSPVSSAPVFSTPYELLDTDPVYERYPDQGRSQEPATAIGDLNGDGLDDIVTMAGSWLSRGDGTFEPRYTGWGPAIRYDRVALGDLDNDGRLDLLGTANHRLWIQRGRGDGSFEPSLTSAPLRSYLGLDHVRLLDWNGDGRLDVYVGRYESAVWFGKGDCTFDTTSYSHLFVAASIDIATGNVRGDERLEFIGSGDGVHVTTWSPPDEAQHEVFGTKFGEFVVCDDFDGDGWDDVAQGTGLYRGGAAGLVLPTSLELDVQRAADVNGDGRVDLLGTRDRMLAIQLGRGDGTFEPAIEYPSGDNPGWIHTGDFDGDGAADALVRRPNSPQALVYLRFNQPKLGRHASTTTGPSKQVVAGDFNEDGHADALVLGVDGSLSLLRGDGTGGMSSAELIDTPTAVARIVMADLDGDGRKDLATVASSDGRLDVRRTLGSGGFDSPISVELPIVASWIGDADLDLDGDLDLVVADREGKWTILRNPGDGDFVPPPTPTNSAPGPDFVHYCLGDGGHGDFDSGDGRLDLTGVRTGRGIQDVLTWKSTLSGEFVPSPRGGGGFTQDTLAIPAYRELDGEKPSEFVCVLDDPNTWLITRATRTRVSVNHETVAIWSGDFWAAEGASAFLVADLDGDGHVEYTSAGSRVNALSIWTSEDLGIPTVRRCVAVDVLPSSIASADFNEDGRLDLIVVHSGAPTAVVLLDVSSELAPRLANSAVASVTGAGVSIEWSANRQRDRWARVARRDDGGLETVTAPFRLDSEGRWSYADENVVPGRRYTYRMLVDTEDGLCVAGVATVKVPTSNVTPLPIPVPAERSLTIANPSRGSTLALRLDGFAGESVDVTLHNVAGRVVGRWQLNGGGSAQLARPADLPPGVYLIRTVQGASILSRRIVLL